jgi:hypothetical protein
MECVVYDSHLYTAYVGMSGAVYPHLICYHGILVVVEDRVEFCGPAGTLVKCLHCDPF